MEGIPAHISNHDKLDLLHEAAMDGTMLAKILAAAIAFTSLASAGYSESVDPKSGAFWYRHCSNTNASSYEAVLCRLYIRGFIGGTSAIAAMSPSAHKLFCLPTGSTQDQVRLVVAKYMSANEMVLHASFDYVIYLALTSSFPCPQS